MNEITKPSFMQPFLLSLVLTTAISACSTAKTSSTAPSSTDTSGQSATSSNANTQGDAQSDIRKKQIESDIRAREQRNKLVGNSQNRTEGDLASEVRGKLETNIPSSQLTVEAKGADVTVSGTVKTKAELDKIKPLALQIKGVKNVMVKAAVKP
jgi:hyperosmotically inducible periplasmic protein